MWWKATMGSPGLPFSRTTEPAPDVIQVETVDAVDGWGSASTRVNALRRWCSSMTWMPSDFVVWKSDCGVFEWSRLSPQACAATVGQVRLADVTHSEVQRWLTRLDLAPASVRKVHRVLSMMLAYAAEGWPTAVNPAAGVRATRTGSRERFLSHRQGHRLAEACGDDYRLMVLFLAYTGLRRGEMPALTVGPWISFAVAPWLPSP